MSPPSPHRWVFSSHFRASSFGPYSSKLACQRLREAVSEIRKATRKDPVLGAEGAVRLIERIWPAFQGVDSSSGALGTAVNNALESLIPVVACAPADADIRAKWLSRLWEALQEDGVDYLWLVGDRWGELCGSPEVASKWADDLLPMVRACWSDPRPGGSSRGSSACLSSLVAGGRFQETLDLIECAPLQMWHYRQFGVRALAAMGKHDEALQYAESSRSRYDPYTLIDQACEGILLSQGRHEEAYHRYAFTANEGTSNLATFRAIARKYPDKEPTEILRDLIDSRPGEEGKWFATAKTLGFLDLALELARKSPCDPKTLNRAARDFLKSEPQFALGTAMASLHWLTCGYGYEITGLDVHAAYRYAREAAVQLGIAEQVMKAIKETVDTDGSPGMFVKEVLGRELQIG